MRCDARKVPLRRGFCVQSMSYTRISESPLLYFCGRSLCCPYALDCGGQPVRSALSSFDEERFHGQVRQDRANQGRKVNEGIEERDAAQRNVGEKSQNPQASDRNRPLGGTTRGGQGPIADPLTVAFSLRHARRWASASLSGDRP